MLSGAEALNNALRQSHTPIVSCIVEPADGEPSYSAFIKDGSFTQDRTAQIRSQVNLTLALEDTAGTAPLIRPFGDKIRVRCGIITPDGLTFAVQIGYFRVDTVEWTKPGAEAVIQASDFMAQVADTRFTAPRLIRRDADARGVIIQLVDEVLTGVEPPPSSGTISSNAGSVYDRERIDAITDLAKSLGSEAKFNNLGLLVVEEVPDGTADPVWEIDSGNDGVLIEYGAGYDRARSYNAVIAEGRSPYGRPIRAQATNDDPSDPLRWGGPFGKIPYFYNSDVLRTVAQCQAAADSLLADGLGKANPVDIKCVAHAGLEAGDVIRVMLSNERFITVLIDRISLPLGPGDMSISGRIVSGTL